MLFNVVSLVTINGKFKLCNNLALNRIVDTNELCKARIVKENVNFGRFSLARNNKYKLYTRNNHAVDGIAYQCRKTLHTLTFEETFFGAKHSDYKQRVIPLTPRQCWNMVIDKLCENRPMSREHNVCVLEDSTNENFSWWRTNVVQNFSCDVVPRSILGDDLNSKVLSENCRVGDYSCLLKDSIIVWNSSVVHSCPFTFVMETTLINSQNLFFNKSRRLLFQFEKDEYHCN